MSRLSRYLNRVYFLRFSVVLLAVTGFAVLFDLLDVGPRVARRLPDTSWPLVRYAFVRLPSLVSELLPMVALVAGLFAVTDLLRFRELVAMWGAGVSRLGLVARLWPAMLVVAGLKFVVDDRLIPATFPTLRALGVAETRGGGPPRGDALWVRLDGQILRLPADAAARKEPRDLLILRLDDQGRLIERLDVAEALPAPEAWLLRGVVRRPAGASAPEYLPELLWPVRLDIEELATLSKPPRELSSSELVAVIAAAAYGVTSTEGHETWLHARIAGMLGIAAIVALPVTLVRRAGRAGATLTIFVRGLAIGFGYVIGNGILLALGELGLMPPVLAAWTAPSLLGLGLLSGAGFLEKRRGRVHAPSAAVVP
ncbi:MAG: LptF/LptG family permease [Geminicoccaceae bacterium]|nr:LptF/LptG family permease [Geminicoccaceae bacterium]